MFSNSEDVKSAKQLLEQLTAGANGAESASNRCKQTLSDLQRLLDPNTLPVYHFKTRKSTTRLNGTSQSHQTQASKLSPFARMVMEQADVQYRYLTPESPEPEARSGASKKASKAHSKTPQGQVNGYGAVPQATPSSQQRKVYAVIPSDISPSQRAEYQYIPDSDAVSGNQYLTPSTRPNANGLRIMSVEQRQKGDLAVQNLQNVLVEIFDAEDQFQSDAFDSRMFTIRDTDEGPVSTLQSETQSKLESCIAKAVSAGRLLDVDVEHLARAQRLCEVSVTGVDNLSLLIGEDWSEEDTAEWLARIHTTETGLMGARALIRIMNGAAQQKELQSEDYLKNVLETLKTVIETCLVPIVEESAFSRERVKGEKGLPPFSSKFLTASSNRKFVLPVLNGATKCMRLLGDLLVKTEFDETAISSVEYLCKTIIFAENTSTEKESALGIQNFETLRRCAMDVLAKIFTKYDAQRQYIFDEILVSLEKLPATKQSARQYRLPDSKPIQLVSALLMRLVQTSATQNDRALKLRSKAQDDEDEDNEEEEASEDESSGEDEEEIRVSPAKRSNGSPDLASLTKPLHDAAQTNARYIVHVLVTRALSTSKSSEEPYRKLLDIFTEDFLNVLGSSDWPAAEVLLRMLLMRMIGIIERDSSPAPARTLALELLGVMGSGILELQLTARDTARTIDTTESAIVRHLCNMIKQLEAGNADASEMLSFDGPYRVLIEYLEARSTGDDPQLQTARGYHLMEWAYAAAGGREGSADSDASDGLRSSQDLRSNLKHMLLDRQWLDEHSGMHRVSTAEGRLAAMTVTLNSTFCRAFNRIFNTLLTSMSSDQSSSTVKSRALKSVVTLLEKDASILERNSHVLQHIFRCASDSSPLVRDSALGLIDKCLALQPGLHTTAYKALIARTHDAAVGVRKRAMRMLKDVYLKTNVNAIRSAIANAIIARIHDSEENIIEIARTTMEEIWLEPLHGMKLDGERAIQAKLAFGSQAALIIETVEQSDEMMKVLEPLLKRLLTRSKAAEANSAVCKTIIAVLFDGTIDNKEIPGSPPQSEILRSLTIFARACPDLFTPTQLERLEPYTQNLDNTDDLDVYRSVIIILRHVIPHQPVMRREFLDNMQTTLLRSMQKLHKSELNEVAPCLWTISRKIEATKRLANAISSVLGLICQLRGDDLTPDQQRKLIRLVRIAGEFGNACDFEKELPDFRQKFAWFKGPSVPALIVEIICPFTSPKRPLEIRVECLEAICTVSKAWPKQFLRTDVSNAFETVFRERDPSLEKVLLSGLEGFFIAQEVPDENADDLDPEAASGTDRLGKTYVASDQDGASTSMAQRFMPQILQLALASYDARAFVAARLVVSINKQGLVHPKESGPALVALETCPNKAIAAEAFKEHKSQHQKHETLFEKEYIRAVQRTFEYQRNVIGDPAGFVGQPATSKMHLTWEVLKIGKAQVRKKFLANVAQKLDFDPAALDTTAAQQHQLLYVKFCTDNLAFFEYDRVDDVLHLLNSLDKVFAGTGSAVAQAIESEVLKLRVEGLVGNDGYSSQIPNGDHQWTMPNGGFDFDFDFDFDTIKVGPMSADTIQVGTMPMEATAPTAPVDIDSARLQQLAISAKILTLIWETRSFLVRVWNMQKHMRSKKLEKDATKAPNRATNAPWLTDAYLKRTNEASAPLDGYDIQRATCSAFADLISVDNEVKVASDEEAEVGLANGYDTPSEGSSRKSPSVPGSGRGKKRKAGSVGNTPSKRARPSLGKRKSTSGSKYAEESDEDGGWD